MREPGRTWVDDNVSVQWVWSDLHLFFNTRCDCGSRQQIQICIKVKIEAASLYLFSKNEVSKLLQKRDAILLHLTPGVLSLWTWLR